MQPPGSKIEESWPSTTFCERLAKTKTVMARFGLRFSTWPEYVQRPPALTTPAYAGPSAVSAISLGWPMRTSVVPLPAISRTGSDPDAIAVPRATARTSTTPCWPRRP